MRLFDPRSSHWAIRHIYVVMATIGLVALALIQPLGGYLSVRDQELFAKTSFDDPNFMYLHDGGDATLVGMSLFVAGIGLLQTALALAIGYLLIRHGISFESLRLQGAKAE